MPINSDRCPCRFLTHGPQSTTGTAFQRLLCGHPEGLVGELTVDSSLPGCTRGPTLSWQLHALATVTLFLNFS